MRSDVFTSVMRKFSNRVRGNGERKVILLMDNFSGHKMLNEHTRELTYAGGFKGFQYHNVYVLFLPPNCTSVVQPLDQGIIAAFKAHYCRQHVAFNLQELEKGTPQQNVKVNMLQVLQWMREARRHIEGETISNCWVKTKILPLIYENELRGDANRKVKRGVAHFQQDFDALASDLSSMKIADAPTAEEILTMPLEVVVDAAKRIVGEDEGE